MIYYNYVRKVLHNYNNVASAQQRSNEPWIDKMPASDSCGCPYFHTFVFFQNTTKYNLKRLSWYFFKSRDQVFNCDLLNLHTSVSTSNGNIFDIWTIHKVRVKQNFFHYLYWQFWLFFGYALKCRGRRLRLPNLMKDILAMILKTYH